MLSFCGEACVRAYCDPARTASRAASEATESRCAQCSSRLEAPWTSESRALLVELARVVRAGPALERALRALNQDSVLALRQLVRDLEWELTSVRDEATRLGLRGLH